MADDTIELLKASLRSYCACIPRTHSTWSFQRTQEFKKAIMSAQRTLAKLRVTPGELTAKINEMHSYW